MCMKVHSWTSPSLRWHWYWFTLNWQSHKALTIGFLFHFMIITLCNGDLRIMYEAASCTESSIRVHRGAATSNNLVSGHWLSINEGKQGDADRIQMSGCGDLQASHTDNTVYIINHVAKLISRRWTLDTLSLNLIPHICLSKFGQNVSGALLFFERHFWVSIVISGSARSGNH